MSSPPAQMQSPPIENFLATVLLIKRDKTERFTTALEVEWPVSSEISDFTPYAHAGPADAAAFGPAPWCLGS